MARTRISTTVDSSLLEEARRATAAPDSALIDEALAALLGRRRAAEIDAAYVAYDSHPLDERDEWGDLRVVSRRCRLIVTTLPARGEVWWCELPQAGRRPVVVLSRDAAIPRLRRALVAPCTTTIRGIPSEVLLEPAQDPIPRVSAVNLDSVESVSTGTLVERIGRLGDDRIHQVCEALAIAVDCRA